MGLRLLGTLFVLAAVVATVLSTPAAPSLTAASAETHVTGRLADPRQAVIAQKRSIQVLAARAAAARSQSSRSAARRPAGWLAPQQIARAVGAPASPVVHHWPTIDRALRSAGLTSRAVRIAAIATVVTEVGNRFLPINEYGGPAYFRQMYDGRTDLGNTRPGDGVRFHGRGYIQITGRANYASYGKQIGVDLVRRPTMALRPDVGARILAHYFKQRGVGASARRGNWRAVRLEVNGGLNGWARYRHVVTSLERASAHAGSGR
ncbi:MAG: glycoside hydrolase family 19 protein [Nocardioidaceae bacterium]